MKPNSPKPPSPGPGAEPGAAGPATGLPPRRRRWQFRLAAAALPILGLVLLEGSLRIFGFGFPTGFFLPSRVRGQEMLIENRRFTRRFFPARLARTPQSFAIPAHKSPDTCRIFIMGESAAMGDPEPAFAFGRILAVLLGAEYPGRKFEVINAALTAINSHVIREIARDCAAREGDLWILYMGNNEVVGPFGAGTVFGAQTPGLGFIRAETALKATRTGQLIDAIREHLVASRTPPAWEGMEMFLEQRVAADDRKMKVVYDHFQKNLESILEMAEASGARILLSTIVTDLRTSPPFASVHGAGLTAARIAEWDGLYQAAVAHENAGNHSLAVAQYEKAAKIDDGYAELHFRLGRCRLALDQEAEARKSFQRARDLDALRFRADSRINELIRQTAARRTGPALKFLDAEAALSAGSPHGIPGDDLLLDHVHFNFTGNYRLARMLSGKVRELLPARVTGSVGERGPLLSMDECARRLAFTDWDRYQVVDEMFNRLQRPPFTAQLGHEDRDQRLQKQRGEWQRSLRPEAVSAAMTIYREALAPAPDDAVLHENFAKLLQDVGENAGAEQEWRQVIRLLPHYEQAWYSLGNVLDAQGRSIDAVRFFNEALRRRPDSPEARNGLGLALAGQGRVAEAVRQYHEALRRNPDFVEARVNLGELLATQGKTAAATAEYLAALRSSPDNVAAHLNLGKLLAQQGRIAEATAHYHEAVRLAPANAVAQYNLGNALLTRGDPDALEHFAEAVRQKPDFAEARYNLGLELARRGRTAEALEQFAEVVRLRPGFSEAQLNLGVALARERRFGEAIDHLREVLRLDPANLQARKYLEQAEALKSSKP